MELPVLISNCQPDIPTRMSHWHRKFSMSKTKLLIPCCNHCQLALFLLLCPQLTKQHYHPPSCLYQKPWVIFDSSLSLISISNPSASSSRVTSNIYLKSDHFSPQFCNSSCHYLLPLTWSGAKALKLPPFSTSCFLLFIIHFLCIHESELLKL